MLSDKILNYQSFEELYIKCNACNRNDHTVDRCPFIHYVPQREFMICRHLFNKPIIDRDPFKRKSKKTINPRSHIQSVQRKMKDFLSSLNIEQESVEEFSESDSSEEDDNFEPVAASSGIHMNSLTKINKKSVMITEPLPSSQMLRNPIKELSSVMEIEKDEDNSTNIMDRNGNYEKKLTSEPYNEEALYNSSHHIKKKETTFKHEKTMEREASRKYSVFPDSMVDGKTNSYSRGERERTTKIQSGIYPPTSILNEKNDIGLRDFDKMMIFNYYFPQNNIDNVVRNLHYKRLPRKSTKMKMQKSGKTSRKTKANTKNFQRELSNLGLAIRLPSLMNEKDQNCLDNQSPQKWLRPKKSFFTENDDNPNQKKDEVKK